MQTQGREIESSSTDSGLEDHKTVARICRCLDKEYRCIDCSDLDGISPGWCIAMTYLNTTRDTTAVPD